MEMLNPRGRSSQAETIKPAARIADLRGKTIGLLDNSKPNAGKFLRMVTSVLKERYGVGEVVHLSKVALSKPAPTEMIEELARKADFILCAIGD